MAVLPTASESPLLYACELWVFAMCPALRGSTVSYAGDAHFPKHSLEYSLNFWSQSKKKKDTCSPTEGAFHRAEQFGYTTHTDSTSKLSLSLLDGSQMEEEDKASLLESWANELAEL